MMKEQNVHELTTLRRLRDAVAEGLDNDNLSDPGSRRHVLSLIQRSREMELNPPCCESCKHWGNNAECTGECMHPDNQVQWWTSNDWCCADWVGDG